MATLEKLARVAVWGRTGAGAFPSACGSGEGRRAPVTRPEDLTDGTRLTGLAASGSASVESVQWIGRSLRSAQVP